MRAGLAAAPMAAAEEEEVLWPTPAWRGQRERTQHLTEAQGAWASELAVAVAAPEIQVAQAEVARTV